MALCICMNVDNRLRKVFIFCYLYSLKWPVKKVAFAAMLFVESHGIRIKKTFPLQLQQLRCGCFICKVFFLCFFNVDEA